MEVSGKRSDITEEGAAEELEKFCEVCEVDHVTTKANGICRECEQLMCDTCFNHHLKVKSCRQHMLVDTNQSLSPVQGSAENVEKCKYHANEKIKYYCRKHEVVGCGDCMIPGHSTCKAEHIKDLSKEFRQNEDFKSLLIKLESTLSANKENDKKIKESKEANTDMLGKALEDIKTFRTEINSYLDKAESNIIKEAKDIECKNDKLVTKLEQDCKRVHSKMKEVSQKLDKEFYQDSALFIQTVDCKPRVLDIEQEVVRIQRENDIRTFAFMPDKQLQDIITSTAKLGSLDKKESQSPMNPDTTRLTKEVDTEAFAGHVKQTEPVEEKKENVEETTQKSANQVAVGVRVRPIGYSSRYDLGYHDCRLGTVTAIHKDGTVVVKWEATGEAWAGYRIGLDVELM